MHFKRLDSLKSTIRGKLYSKQIRPSITGILSTLKTDNPKTNASNTDLPPDSTNLNSDSLPAFVEACAGANSEYGRPNRASFNVTYQPLRNIDEVESRCACSQFGDMKYFGPERNIRSSVSSDSKSTTQLPPRYLENLNTQDFSVLIQDLRTRLIVAGGHHTQHYLDITAALEEKYSVLLQEKYDILLQRKTPPGKSTEGEVDAPHLFLPLLNTYTEEGV